MTRAENAGSDTVRILLVGEEHIRDKVARLYGMLHEKWGIRTEFFVDDRSGYTRAIEERLPLPVHYSVPPSGGPRSLLRYWRDFRRVFERLRPQVLEVYTAINPVVLLPMIAYARARGAKITVVCRGELHPVTYAGAPEYWRAALTWMLRSAHLIIYRELYMEEILQRLCPRVPRLAWHNAVIVGSEPEYRREGNRVLFLNAFHAIRNPDVLIRAAAIVRRSVPDVQFDLVGSTASRAEASPWWGALHQYEQGLHALIAELGVHDCVHIHPFTAEVAGYYQAAKVFAFPSEHVFCNNSLLEAMERGVPAVTSDEKDPDARLMVEHDRTGLLVPIEPVAVAEAIVALLTDEERRQRLGHAARRAVQDRFDLEERVDGLAGAYHAVTAGERP